MKKFYIDESGNTGDVVKTGSNYDFGNQPLFALSAIGVNDLEALDKKVAQLKRKHKIQQKELKSTKIYKNKPDFICDLIDYLILEKLPFFVELVDKKYFISSNIVNCVVMPPYYNSNNQSSLLVRNIFSDFIYSKDSSLIYDGFVNCCLEPSESNLLGYMTEVKDYFDKYAQYFSDPDRISENIAKNIEESLDDFNHIKKQEKENAFKRFIPIPDENKNGKDVWLLPNLSSFNSIYARINKYKKGKLSEVTIMHDEQAQFDDILTKVHEELGDIDGLAEVATHSGDYNFIEKAQLQFIDSKDSTAVQVSDVLSGFVMRYIQDSLYAENSIDSKLVKAFAKLKNSWSDSTNVGINFVIPHYRLSNI
ncbi:DUF3800 domain-containing protein [Vibrio cyclitrophicus]|uniref:DUF3800 domain-containing protein n=1 Tax=Vibrio cyclitrophicus TaxID=47951 RepID=UPI0007EEE64C|nr:DUF3800 domain-containing protein [Vibrio cyclitrophicus]OBT23456.1 hypothetical protein A9263_10320 [Vibrio cyclitrophicus]PMF42389.1 hypothetical protein BCV15_13405 [Vibrio cyclitrophicus]